ncbi:iap-3 [Alphabaculovirus alterspexiguae]|uniref:Iap-3 n=1 Tax=Spodoptera exigua multiple nucleopolyhedrovirus TaxID=10454 RepID=A0A3G2JU35_9ABAC|nr:iap-3 [Spodoptera exigua multiple nucleopolyhedrovirus]AYN45059.1 iap-3 [Spodoptera exigua multiple nucleopolyhedrovirus]
MQSFEERLMSFESWPTGHAVAAESLARAGFYYLGRGDEVRCAFCKVEIMNWQADDDPVLDHKRWAPQCKFIKSIECGNVNNLAHPYFESYSARLKTFDNVWPQALSQKPHDLAEAGFFYTGVGDMVVCFQNNCMLHKWNSEDLPWIEHARWFGTCPFVQRTKGPDFVQRVISEACVIKQNIPAVVAEMAAADEEKKDDNLISDEEKKDDNLICKICFENRNDICFMPCGHVVACHKCALNVDVCPLCRNKFINVQRLYFA